ncbi:hypothetical protein ACQ4M3_19300 [Leptolyngbya sp. AN03gr2]|uniref:hypothetical protein n=1 Tax=Leptolyngbya sp. AN03gr2 TaxID=3423364 RepID=UPI003D321023
MKPKQIEQLSQAILTEFAKATVHSNTTEGAQTRMQLALGTYADQLMDRMLTRTKTLNWWQQRVWKIKVKRLFEDTGSIGQTVNYALSLAVDRAAGLEISEIERMSLEESTFGRVIEELVLDTLEKSGL